MRRSWGLLGALLLASGCATPRQAAYTATVVVGGGTLMAGTYMGAAAALGGAGDCDGGAECNRVEPRDAGIVMGVGLGIMLLGAVIIELVSDAPRGQEIDDQRVVREARLRALMKAATDAAAIRDCAGVRSNGRLILKLDPEFHATVFRRDAAIEPCLAP